MVPEATPAAAAATASDEKGGNASDGGGSKRKDPLKQGLEALQRALPHVGEEEKLSQASVLAECAKYLKQSKKSAQKMAEEIAQAGFIFGRFFGGFFGHCSTPRQCHRRFQIYSRLLADFLSVGVGIILMVRFIEKKGPLTGLRAHSQKAKRPPFLGNKPIKNYTAPLRHLQNALGPHEYLCHLVTLL